MSSSPRDHRVDFFRGVALASIFINHVPGNVWEAVTHKNFGFSDAAEVFVLLAGYASAFAYFARYERGETFDAAKRAWKRAGVLYVSHIFTTLLALALFCAASVWFADPAYLDDSIIYVHLKPFFADSVRGIIGLATMGHQLGYFNILPMYTVLLLMVPAMLWLAARDLRLLLGASATLWLASGAFTLDMPNYPLEGGWFFNPLAWQFLFAIGLVLGIRSRRGAPLVLPGWLVKIAIAYCLLALLWVVFDLWSWQPAIPKDWWWAHHFYMFDKTYVSVPRLLHVLALAVLVTLPPWGSWLKRIPASSMLTAMGRHSLPVFCAGSLLAMAGAILRHELGGSFTIDTLIVGGGILLLGILARLLDGGSHAGDRSSRPAPETRAQSPLPQLQ